MIEVIIRHVESDTELGKITIERLTPLRPDDGKVADYSVRFGVEKIKGIGIHQRAIYGFPRRQYNILALLRQALATLEPEELVLDGNPDKPPSKSALRRNILRSGRLKP